MCEVVLTFVRVVIPLSVVAMVSLFLLFSVGFNVVSNVFHYIDYIIQCVWYSFPKYHGEVATLSS